MLCGTVRGMSPGTEMSCRSSCAKDSCQDCVLGTPPLPESSHVAVKDFWLCAGRTLVHSKSSSHGVEFCGCVQIPFGDPKFRSRVDTQGSA